MISPRIALSELRRLTSTPMMRLALCALLLVPTLYAGLYLYANRDPYGSMNNVPAAIVVEDKGTTLSTGERLDVGSKVAKQLVDSGSFEWHQVDRAEAENGVAEQRYDFALIVPADFSADLASAGTQKPRKATLEQVTNDGNGYLARTISNQVVAQVTKSVASEVSASAAAQLLNGFTTVHDNLTKAVDGAGKLADGNSKLASGAHQLASGATRLGSGVTQLKTGSAQLASGADSANSGAAALASGSRTLQKGASSLASGAATLNSGLTTAASSADKLATGAGSLASGLGTLDARTAGLPAAANKLAAGSAQLAAGTQQFAERAGQIGPGVKQIAAVANQLAGAITAASTQVTQAGAGADQIRQALLAEAAATQDPASAARLRAIAAKTGQLAEGLTAGADKLQRGTVAVPAITKAAQTLSAGADQASAGARQLNAGATQVAAGNAALAKQVPALRGGITQAHSGAAQVAAGNKALASGLHSAQQGSTKLADGAVKVATGASSLSAGATKLAAGTSSLASGAHRLDTGIAQAQSGAQQLTSGGTSLAKGADSAAQGARQLRDQMAQGADKIPAFTKAQREAAAQTIGAPVEVAADNQDAAATYGAGMAPFFLSLALWIGGYVLFLMIRPLSNRALAAGQNPVRVALAGWITPALLALVQMCVAYWVVFHGLGFAVQQPLVAWLYLGLIGLTYTAILHALVAWLGSTGNFVGLVLMILQLVSGGGTFPWQTLPGPLQALHPLLPMSYAIDGLRHLLYGGSAGAVASDAAVLVGFLAASIVFSTLAARRARVWTPKRVAPDVILGG